MTRHRLISLALVVLALAAIACDDSLVPPTLESGGYDGPGTRAAVVAVIDGDTIRVEVGGDVIPVRYIGIDAPETGYSDGAPEWMATEATEANRRLVEGQTVYLERDVSDTDRYDRLLRYVFLDDGMFVNAELARLGYAEAKSYAPDTARQELLDRMERQAREAGRGLWGPGPTADVGG